MSLTPTAFGASPKFDSRIWVGIETFYAEFGGGREGVWVLMRNYALREVS